MRDYRKWTSNLARFSTYTATLGLVGCLALLNGCAPCETDAECDDGVFCNGAETCDLTDPDNAACVDGTAPCLVDQTCDEDNDQCTGGLCTVDTECDDGVFCNGAETCDLSQITADGAGVCVSGTAPCTGANETCDEATDSCTTSCTDDAGCDDGDPCNGAETCDLTDPDAGVCAGGTAPDCDDGDACTTDSCDANDANADPDTGCVNTDITCDAGETCVGGACVKECTSAAGCDDNDPCTNDSCVNNTCVNTAKDCDDGLFCTGTNTCNADTGVCETGNSPCAAGQSCDEVANECTDQQACTADVDCDNGVFCNGAESCDLTDPDNGVCVDGTPPCEADETCNEATASCDPPPGTSERLTLGTDTITTGSGDDSFDGSLEVSGGNLFQTLNNADNLNGAGGTDTLTAQFQNGGTTTPAGLNGIEIFNLEITDANNTTLNMLNADSATTINNNNSGANLTVMNISAFSSAVGMSNTTQNTTITVSDAVVSGGSDEVTLNVSGVTVAAGEPVVILQPTTAGSGYETINLNSSGGVANNLDDVQDGNGNSFATLNVSGSQDVKIDDALNATVTTVNGSMAAGDIDVMLSANNATVTGGSGDDTFRFGGNFDANDTVDGGAGDDTLNSAEDDFSGTAANQTNVSNVETLATTNALAANLNVVHWGATNAMLAGTGAFTVTLPSGGTIELNTANATGNLTAAISGSDTTTDTLNVTLNGADLQANALVAGSFENVNLECQAAACTTGALTLNNTAATETLTCTGGVAFDVNGAITADVIDASATTAGFDNVGAAAAGATSITGGSGADSLRGSAGADIIAAGDGNDRVQGDAGSDLMTGGGGNDTFDQDNIALADTDTISDFDAGTSTSTNDIFIWDISSIELFAGVTDLVDTSAVSAVAGDSTFVQLGSDGQTVASADIVGLIGDYTNAADALANQASWTIVYGAALAAADAYLVAYTSGANVRIAVAIDGGGANSDGVTTLVDIAILQNVSLSNLDSGDFNSEA